MEADSQLQLTPVAKGQQQSTPALDSPNSTDFTETYIILSDIPVMVKATSGKRTHAIGKHSHLLNQESLSPALSSTTG